MILTDVVSFDVRVLIAGQTDFTDLASLPAQSYVNPAFGSVYVNGTAQQVYVYDTWSGSRDGTYDYSSGWNLSYPVSGSVTGSNTSVPLRRLFNPSLAPGVTQRLIFKSWRSRFHCGFGTSKRSRLVR